ncbi:FtsK/SpoIIIE domain-containing protein [Mycobacteroides abscessus]|uniref:FtsK/SpoIIIE domain-containing protein n=1 Tax=Mycobacteroides abscessus TaxID=36809 RepID=UPI0009A782E1|nr:FtsK/SpoIIIE domain-containing protein [Mycobacteroides abscessus]SKT85370.1 cell division protein FtsK [Mycobacteroides abscessus subsp. massiliense]SKU05361.1 cell division protein FtsK [Mycobacteroides abscessus subsp. massiliense]
MAEPTPPPGVAPKPGRPYATHSDELTRPVAAGEATSAAQKAKTAQEWRYIILGAIALGVFVAYAKVWPVVQTALYRPSPLRDYLLPPSTQPLFVVAGVGVGWFWLMFLAIPAALGVSAGLWWIGVATHNRRARTGRQGQVRPGQEWRGERFAGGPILAAAGAGWLLAGGVLLRWMAPATANLIGQLLVIGVFAVAVWGYVQLISWVRARSVLAQQINRIAFLTGPTLGWPDLRGDRVRVLQRSLLRGEPAFPKVLELLYAQHPRDIGADQTIEVEHILLTVTGRTYQLTNEILTKKLVAIETVLCDEETDRQDAETVLAPQVAAWFDTTARIINVEVCDEPVDKAARRDEEGKSETSAQDSAAEGDDAAKVDANAAATELDKIAGRIKEFTIEFVLGPKVNNGYRRGIIESAVADTFGGSWSAEWSLISRRVRFVRSPGLETLVDPPLEFPVVNRKVIRQLYKKSKIPFAVDAYGNVIVWDFRLSPHFLVAGPTSTGKTSLLMTVATQCARRGFNVMWIDPKGQDSPGLYSFPNFSMVTRGFDVDGMVAHTAALRFIADTMRERYAQVKANPNKADDFDPIIVICDEFSNLVTELTRFYMKYKNSRIDKGKFPTEEDVGTILRTARAVGIHLVIGLQRPDTAFIAGEARDNTSLRVAMGRLRSKEAAMMMFNDPMAGTRLEPGIKGRGTVQLPDNTFREIQVFYTPLAPATAEQVAALSPHERDILTQLSDVESFWPRVVVNSVLREFDEEAPPSFAQIRDSEIVLAAEHPELDPLSDQYVPPVMGRRKPTMDDLAEVHAGGPDPLAGQSLLAGMLAEGSVVDVVDKLGAADVGELGASLGTDVDGYADEYLPNIDEEYGPMYPMAANELTVGDLVDISVDGSGDWRYIHAEPYWCDYDNGEERVIIPYREIGDSQETGDIDVDPHEVYQVRQPIMK